MQRLDVTLYEKKLFPTREKAKEAINSGIVFVDKKCITKAGTFVEANATIQILGEKLQYVSRSGLKLEKASVAWNIDFKNKIVLDVGASTGGFTDFALKNGAKKVYALDVGKDQLHPSLKANNHVINMEKTDFRAMPNICDKIDIAVCDCSFISLNLLIPKFKEVLQKNKHLVVLIKPQFECGPTLAKKYKGVIKDAKLQENLKNQIIQNFKQNGFVCLGNCESPILGTAGNKEFLAYFIKN